MKRNRWGFLLVESLFEELMKTEKTLKAIMLERGYNQSGYTELIQWIYRDPERTARYLAARRVKVRRMGVRLLDISDDELLARGGKRFISRELHRRESVRPMRQRRADAVIHRARRAALDPLGEALRQARRRAKRARPVVTELEEGEGT